MKYCTEGSLDIFVDFLGLSVDRKYNIVISVTLNKNLDIKDEVVSLLF